MAKSGNNENKVEKLVRVGFYELEKTIGKGVVDCVTSEVITECYLINTKPLHFSSLLSMKWKSCRKGKLRGC